MDNLLNATDNTVEAEGCTLANIKTVLNYSLAIEPPVAQNNTVCLPIEGENYSDENVLGVRLEVSDADRMEGLCLA